MSSKESSERPLRVSAPVSFGLARVGPYMASLRTQHPGLRVNLRLEDRLSDLVLDGVDVAIRVGNAPPDRADIVAHSLFTFHRIPIRSTFRCNALQTLRDLSLAGAGVAQLPEWLVRDERRRRTLRRVLPQLDSTPVAVYALHRTKHRGSSRVKTFIAHLRAAYRE